MKIRKSTVVLTIATLYGVNYFIFERILFFNELLSLIGFIYFVKTSFRKNSKFYYPPSAIYRLVLLFLLVSGVYAIISLFIKTNWYFYFRNLSIIYSVFPFFIGFYLYHEQFYFFNRIRIGIYAYAFLSFTIGKLGLIDRNAYSFWFSLLQKNWKWLGLLGFVAIHLLYVMSYTSLTVIVIMVFILAIRYFIKTYSQFKFVMLLLAIAFLLLFIGAMPYLQLYRYNNEYLFGNVEYVYNHHPWFWIDPNSSWRLIFWYRTLVEAFPSNLLGIGLGTPLLPYLQNVNTTGLPYNDMYIAHVIGTHNTFVTIFVRLGVVALVLLLTIYRFVFREFFLFKTYYSMNRNDGGLFLSFFTITAVGMFNLVIESPTLAGLYWISLGFVARAILNRSQAQFMQSANKELL